MEEKLLKSLNENWCVRLKTSHPDGDQFDGVVTHLASDFVVLREMASFEFDGIVVLARKFIVGCRDGKYERCCNKILRHNDALKKCPPPRWLDSCTTYSKLLKTMMKKDVWPGVETINRKGTKSAFYLGPVTDVKSKRLRLRCYDATGTWEDTYRLPFEKIFKIGFGNAYCRHFNAYMKRDKSNG